MEGGSRGQAAALSHSQLSPSVSFCQSHDLMDCSKISSVGFHRREKKSPWEVTSGLLIVQAGIKCHAGNAPTQTVPHGHSCHFHRMLNFSIFNKRMSLSGWEKVLAYVKEESHINADKKVKDPDRILGLLVKVQVIILWREEITKIILIRLIRWFLRSVLSRGRKGGGELCQVGFFVGAYVCSQL